MNETNRRTEFQFYWYYASTCFRQPFCPSGVLSRTSALVHFMQILQFHPAHGSKWSSNLHKMYQCMAKNSWWWAERLPETCRVIILIKLEFSASVGFIHKEMNVCFLCYTQIIRLCSVDDECMRMQHWWNNSMRAEVLKKPCPIASLSTMNPTWTDLSLKICFSNEIRQLSA